MQFIIFPAIDLRDGKVVRLRQGDPGQQTTYADDPAKVARQWLAAGAQWLHVVNLDGAFGETDQANQKALGAILQVSQEFNARVQFGGGLRSLDQIASAFELGVDRLVLGTLAVENPEIVSQATQLYGPEHVAVSLDARTGWVQVRGWKQGTQVSALQLSSQLADRGLKWLVYTDISRDGVGTGLNLEATGELALASRLRVIASGGVNSREDVNQARRAHLSGVIIGRALYEGKLNLKAILSDDSI
jgi:phosphoribosylformimino-5-aminoimidazole carboxamide ribotide isomerase